MNAIIATADFTAAMFILLIVIGTITGTKEKNEITKWFIVMSVAMLLGCINDGISYVAEGRILNHTVLVLLNILSYVAIDFALIPFAFYVCAIIGEDEKYDKSLAYVMIVLTILDVLFVVIGALTGKIFYFEDGIFCYGPWSNYSGYITMLADLFLIAFIVLKRNDVGKELVISIITYCVFPILTGFLELINPEVSFVYPAMGLSCMIIYIMIQTGDIQKRQIREEMMMELIRTDELTKLNNRHSFEETIDSLSNEEKVHVVFCDVNGLKYTNDTYGHAAGDIHINNFVGILNKYFPKESMFRISGDEFVVIVKEGDCSNFSDTIEKFKKAVKDHSWIASMGYSYGTGQDIIKLISEAEIEMYDEKEAYYKKTGRNRRR